MRTPRCSRLLSLLSSLLLLPAAAAADRRPAYHIVLSQPRAGAGEDVDLTLVPTPGPGARVRWMNATDRQGVPGEARYYAPFVIAHGTPPAQVVANISGPDFRATATVEIRLLPGSVDGSDECLGPGQTYSSIAGAMAPDERPLEQAPAFIGSSDPLYPPERLLGTVADTILVRVLVCRTGRVIGAEAVPSYAGPFDPQPIPHDPVMVDAALIAVRRYMFMPATRDGQAVAAWATISVPPATTGRSPRSPGPPSTATHP